MQQYMGMIEHNATCYYHSINICLDTFRSLLAAQERQISAWLTHAEHDASKTQALGREGLGKIGHPSPAHGDNPAAQPSQTDAGLRAAKKPGHETQHGRHTER